MGILRDNRAASGRGPRNDRTQNPFEEASAKVLRYEDRLTSDPRWALNEGSIFFEGKGAVQETLRRIAERLDNLGVPYAVVGGLALFQHGFRRFTEDVDLLVTPQSLTIIHAQLEGLGYQPPFTGSKNLRDTSTGVRIEFLVTGQFPGDGKPKPLPFPDPAAVAIEIDGIKYLNLPTLIDLKLASGMTNPDREKDLIDIKELIKVLSLTRELATQLNPYVRNKYYELWDAIRSIKRRYVTIWKNKSLTLDAKSIEEMIQVMRKSADTLAAMQADGVILDHAGRTADDHALLVTENPDVAKKYDMHEESEFWEKPDEEESESELPKGG